MENDKKDSDKKRGPGQPPKPDNQKIKQIKTGYPPLLKERIQEYSDRKNHTSLSSAVVALVQNGLETELPSQIVQQIEERAQVNSEPYYITFLNVVMKGLKAK